MVVAVCVKQIDIMEHNTIVYCRTQLLAGLVCLPFCASFVSTAFSGCGTFAFLPACTRALLAGSPAKTERWSSSISSRIRSHPLGTRPIFSRPLFCRWHITIWIHQIQVPQCLSFVAIKIIIVWFDDRTNSRRPLSCFKFSPIPWRCCPKPEPLIRHVLGAVICVISNIWKMYLGAIIMCRIYFSGEMPHSLRHTCAMTSP